MLKRLKHIKKVGIYRDFVWQDTACFKRYNAVYGFNGSGKSTLARIFNSLNGSKLEYREAGSSVIFEDYDRNELEIKDDQPVHAVLVYDEDFILNNLRWDQGIKSFVVIGKKSKEEEEKLTSLSAQKQKLVTEKKITESAQKHLSEKIGEYATEFASNIRKELIQFSPGKFNRYDRRPFQADVANLQPDREFIYRRDHVSEIKAKINRSALAKSNKVNSVLHPITIDILERVFSFLSSTLPTRSEEEYTQQELTWIESGLHLHNDKDNCLFCLGALSIPRKDELKRNLTNEVAKFIKNGKALADELSGIKIITPDLQTTFFYHEVKESFEDVYSRIKGAVSAINEFVQVLKYSVLEKVEFADVETAEMQKQFEYHKNSTRDLFSELNQLIDSNNQITDDLEAQRKKSIADIERIFINEYTEKIADLNTQLSAMNEKHKLEEKQVHKLTIEITEIEASLQSEAKAISGINNMLNVFLGRSDIMLEFREESKKFEITRKGVPARRLSEGEKTAIAVCYFLILVNANVERKAELIILIDDPISSLDSNNLYNAYAVLRKNLDGIKQVFILTHNLYFFRLIWKWFRDLGNENAYFKIETKLSGGHLSASISEMKRSARETSTEYILLYTHLKSFVSRSEQSLLSDADYLPYPNMLRRLLEAYLFTKFPGKDIKEFDAELTALGVNANVALHADRFCNDFSHARFDSLYGQEGNSINSAPKIVKELISELERIDPEHFNSMKNFVVE